MRARKHYPFYAVASCHGIATLMFAMAGEPYKVVLSFGLTSLWLLLAMRIRDRSLTLKSMTHIFLALAAIYLLTAVDYAMDSKWPFAVCTFAAFLVSGALALWINRRFS